MFNIKSLAAWLLVAAAGIQGAIAARAATTWNAGDLIVGFRSTDAAETNSLLINVGSVFAIRDGGGFSINVNSQLTALYGPDWFTSGKVNFGAVSSALQTNSTDTSAPNGDPGRTTYFTQRTSTIGFAGADIAKLLNATNRTTITTQILSLINGTGGFVGQNDNGNNSAVMLNSNINSWAGKTAGIFDFGVFTSPSEVDAVINNSITYVDLFRMLDTSTNGATPMNAQIPNTVGTAQFVATLRITSDGILKVVSPLAPSVSLVSPAAATRLTVGSSLALECTASDDDGAIASMGFYADGALVATGTQVGNSTTYTANWTPALARSVAYKLTVKATDNEGRVSETAAVDVTVDAAVGSAPVLQLTSPAAAGQNQASASAALGSQVYLSANARDELDVTSLKFYADGVLLPGEVTRQGTTNQWVLNATLSGAPFSAKGVGSYAITAIAADEDLNRTLSAVVTLNVTAPASGSAPTGSLVFPTAGSEQTLGLEVPMQALVSDADGAVASVAFYANGTLMETDTTAPFTAAWKPTVAGAYNLVLVITDAQGATTVTAPVPVTVKQSSKPNASLVTPVAATSLTVGSSLEMQAEASDLDGTIASVGFYADGALVATGAQVGNSTIYTATWSPALAQPAAYKLTVRATDNAGEVTETAAVNVTVLPFNSWALFSAAESALAVEDTGLVTLNPIDKMSVVTGSQAHSAGNALKLQTVDDGSSYAERTIQGPAVVTFAWRVSSEQGFDFFRYSLDGTVMESISGNGSWLARSLLVPAGTHTLRWTYVKDASDASFDDAGYLDDLVILPAYKNLEVKSGTQTLTGSSTLDFGTVQEQATELTQTLDFKNTGTVPIDVTVSLPSGCGFIFENQSSSFRFILEPGFSLPVRLVLGTTVPGAKSGLLSITATGSQATPPAITLSGIVQALTPNIACSWSGGALTNGQTSAVDFGITPNDITFTISNGGTAQLSINSVTVSPSTDFQLVAQLGNTVPVGGNTTFTLRALETTRGTHPATVTITSNAGNAPSFSFPVTSLSYLAVTGTGFTNGTFTNTGTSAGWSTAAVTLPGGGTGQALKTGATPHSGNSTIGATFDGPGLLRWSWQVSAQAGFDWLVCEVNGTEVAGISTKALAWQTQVVQIPAGAAVRWIYRKDAANVAGSDTGYIGDIHFSKFTVPQTTFNDWSAANGDVAPIQAMPKLGLQAMFAWLGGLDPEATPAAGLYTPTVANGLYKYRYRIAKGAAGLVQPEISFDLNTWSSRRMSQTIISEDTNSAVIELSTPATSPVFSRLKADQPAYTDPVP